MTFCSACWEEANVSNMIHGLTNSQNIHIYDWMIVINTLGLRIVQTLYWKRKLCIIRTAIERGPHGISISVHSYERELLCYWKTNHIINSWESTRSKTDIKRTVILKQSFQWPRGQWEWLVWLVFNSISCIYGLIIVNKSIYHKNLSSVLKRSLPLILH